MCDSVSLAARRVSFNGTGNTLVPVGTVTPPPDTTPPPLPLPPPDTVPVPPKMKKSSGNRVLHHWLIRWFTATA
ncbi:hypothetical protein N6Y36_05885 [Morganella morganii]|nr:hypothetical protein N6Y36_05885 [Morganella morganii]